MTDECNILVTGGAGFIGSHLVRKLVRKGHFVRIIDNLSRSNLKDLQPLIDNQMVEFVDGDVRYQDHVNAAVKDVDCIHHLAATNINRSTRYPDESLDVNLRGSQVVFKAALKHKVKRVIFSSSASVYGNPENLPISENSRLSPITPYCVAKLSAEFLLKYFASRGLKYNILRYFNVYGINQKVDAYYTSVIILFIKRILNNLPPIIDGTGEQTMDFVSVRDVVQANILATDSSVENEVFNVGSGISTSIYSLANMLIDALGINITPEFSGRATLVKHRQADISKIQELLNYKVTTFPKEGLMEIAKDIQQNPDDY